LDQRARRLLDGDLLLRLAAGQVDQVHVVANAVAACTEVLVFLFPLPDLITLPVPAHPGRLAVGRPADKLRRGTRLARQLLGQHAPARAVGLDDDGPPGLDVGMPTAGQIGAVLRVADEEGGPRINLWA